MSSGRGTRSRKERGEDVSMWRRVRGPAGPGRPIVRARGGVRSLAMCALAALALDLAIGSIGFALPPILQAPGRVRPSRGFTEFAILGTGGRPSAMALGRDG